GTVAAALFIPDQKVLQQMSGTILLAPVSLFAFVATLCIATYDKRNDQHYDELVARAAELERELLIEHGSFVNRQREWLEYGVIKVGHRMPIGLIYAAAASLWAYLFAAALVPNPPVLTKVAVPTLVIACWLGLRQIEVDRARKQRDAV